MSKLIDISPALSPGLAVWPGDDPLTREVLCDMTRGAPVTLSTLRATAHLGAHADAPSHYGLGGATIDAQPIELYVGLCQVLVVDVAGARVILPDAIADPIVAPRVLISTGFDPEITTFREDFAGLSPALVRFLGNQGVRLVGVDAPSVDPYSATDLPAHRACFENGIAILEGLRLGGVPAGLYELIALPLKLVGFDASPIRAILRQM